MKLNLDHITGDPEQPRKEFDAAELEALAASIQQNGLMQPITVRPAKEADRYWVVAGERRFRAHLLLRSRGAKISSIEVIVKKPPTITDLRVRQIVENVVRADLTPLEEAHGYQDLVNRGLSVEDVAKRLGVKVDRVASRLSLLNLEPSIAALMQSGQLKQPDAFELAKLPNKADQLKLLQMLNRGDLGKWRSLKAAVTFMLEGAEQADMFGGKRDVTDDDVAIVNAMEAKIEQVAKALSAGWKNGECIVATKVSRNRAALMADKLAAIRSAVRHMEQELRNVTAQANIVLGGDVADQELQV